MNQHLTPYLIDRQFTTYQDVLKESWAAITEVAQCLANPEAQQALEIAEERFQRPALAGVVLEIEKLPAVAEVLAVKGTRRNRFKMAVGVMVRIDMESRGWRKTGHKPAVGVGSHFGNAEHYERTGTAGAAGAERYTR